MSGGEGRIAVVAVGGNSLIKSPEHQSIPDQDVAARETVRHIVDFIVRRLARRPHPRQRAAGGLRAAALRARDGRGAARPHGLRGSRHPGRRSATCSRRPSTTSLPGAASTGARSRWSPRCSSTRPIPRCEQPSKPIGSHMSEERAKRIAAEQGWTVREDAGRGWRRVVPSPRAAGDRRPGRHRRARAPGLHGGRLRRRGHPRGAPGRRLARRGRGRHRQGPRVEPARPGGRRRPVRDLDLPSRGWRWTTTRAGSGGSTG